MLGGSDATDPAFPASSFDTASTASVKLVALSIHCYLYCRVSVPLLAIPPPIVAQVTICVAPRRYVYSLNQISSSDLTRARWLHPLRLPVRAALSCRRRQ